MKLILLYLFIIILLAFGAHAVQKSGHKSGHKLRHTQPLLQLQKNQSSYLAPVHMALHPSDWKENPKNALNPIQLDPNGHTLMHPFTSEQWSNLNGQQKIYEKDTESYNFRPVNESNFDKQKMVLVSNMSEYKRLRGIDDNNIYDVYDRMRYQKDKSPAVYRKDPYAYYDPVQTEENIRDGQRQDDHIFIVPTKNLKEVQEEQRIEENTRKSLFRNKGYYYDPTYNYTIKKYGPLEKALIESEKLKLQPPSIPLHKYVRYQKNKQKAISQFLGKKYPIVFRNNPRVHYLLERERIKRHENYGPKVQKDYEIKSNENLPYYDPLTKDK